MIQVELDAPNPTDWVGFHYVCENCALFLWRKRTVPGSAADDDGV